MAKSVFKQRWVRWNDIIFRHCFFSSFGCEKVIYLSDFFHSELIQKSRGFEGPYSEVFDFLVRDKVFGRRVSNCSAYILINHIDIGISFINMEMMSALISALDIMNGVRLYFPWLDYGDMVTMTTMLTWLWWRKWWAIRVNNGNINRHRSQHWWCRKYRLRFLISTSSVFKWQGFDTDGNGKVPKSCPKSV